MGDPEEHKDEELSAPKEAEAPKKEEIESGHSEDVTEARPPEEKDEQTVA
jgi:hypothetical protein